MSFERANIERMTGYGYGEQPADAKVIKLNTNENPYPPSAAVAQALAAMDIASLRRYPPATALGFRCLAAARFGLQPEQVVATNGGDEALRLALTTFVDPGAAFGMASPSYSLYPVLASIQDCRVVAVELGDDWLPPADLAARLNAEDVRLTCLVNPHAPSGALLDAEAIASLAADLAGVLLVDEAYVDFVEPRLRHDLTGLVRRFDNVLLLRTLSKGYALAGVRFGFLLGSAGLIEPIRDKTRDSYNVSALAQVAAEAAFADVEHAQASWSAVRRERQRLRERLSAARFDIPASEANFLLAAPPSDAPPAGAIYAALRDRGILVRHFDTPRLANRLRITVGTPEENDALLEALGEILPSSPDYS